MRVKPPHASVGIIVLILFLGTTSSAFASAAKPHGSFRALTRLDRKAPTAPTSLKVTRVASSSITVAWKSSRDNFGVVGYAVYVNGVLKDRTGTTSDALTGVICGTSYVIAVAAYDLAGNNSQKASVIASTSPCVAAAPTPPPAGDTQTPSAPSGLTETAATGSQVSLSWNAATDNVGVAGYRAYFSGNQAGSTTATNYTFNGLTCGSTYSVGVDAVDAAGNHSTIASAVVATAACPDTLSPTAVANLLPSQITTTTVALWWSPSLDNAGVTGYGIYRNGTMIAATTATAYTVTGLTCGTSYQLGADATDAAANRSSVSTISVTTSACGDTTPPSAPSGLAVTSVFPDRPDVQLVGIDRRSRRHRLHRLPQRDTGGSDGRDVVRIFEPHLRHDLFTCSRSTGWRTEHLCSARRFPPRLRPARLPRRRLRLPLRFLRHPARTSTSRFPATTAPASVTTQHTPVRRSTAPTTLPRVETPSSLRPAITRSLHLVRARRPSIPTDRRAAQSRSPAKATGMSPSPLPVFAFHPGLGGVTFTGSCFRFHVPYFGYGGYTALTHDVILDRVHMDSFECAGCANVTIMNSRGSDRWIPATGLGTGARAAIRQIRSKPIRPVARPGQRMCRPSRMSTTAARALRRTSR